MSHPYDNFTSKILRDLQRYQEVSRHAQALTGPLEQARRQQEMISSVLPYYEASRKLMEISDHAREAAGLSSRAQEVIDSLSPGVPRVQRAMLELLADRAKLDRALSSSFLPSFELTDALARAAASISHLPSYDLAHAPIAFAPMHETVARTLGMRSLIEEQIEPATLRPELRGLLEGLTAVAADSTAVWDRLAGHPDELIELPEFLREVPVLQAFEATRSTGLLLIEEPELIETEPAPGLLISEAAELPARLRAIHPKLVEKYLGALAAFERRENDYVAQVTVSLRELFVHLLESLAPEHAIAAWDASLLPQQGKATYKAQLTYIYRRQATGGYARMTGNEIDLVQQNLKVLNEGVHKLDPQFQHEHVRSLIRRCEYCLVSVLSANEMAAGAE